LSKNGIIFLITSSLSRQIHFNELGYNYNQVGGEVLFFEKLYIWELTEKRNKKDKTLLLINISSLNFSLLIF